jgi:type III restriction enzyme
VLRCYQKNISQFIHSQMQEHYWEEASGYEVKVTKGLTGLRRTAYTAGAKDSLLDYRVSPQDKSNVSKYLFGGFKHCLFDTPQKFQSDAERRLAVTLEREGRKWFRPAKGQFQIFYKRGADHSEYQPDFVAETAECIYMLEPKDAKQLSDDEVVAKKNSAITWCQQASDHANEYGGKPWRYVLIPHSAIADNMTLSGLVLAFGDKV